MCVVYGVECGAVFLSFVCTTTIHAAGRVVRVFNTRVTCARRHTGSKTRAHVLLSTTNVRHANAAGKKLLSFALPPRMRLTRPSIPRTPEDRPWRREPYKRQRRAHENRPERRADTIVRREERSRKIDNTMSLFHWPGPARINAVWGVSNKWNCRLR